MRKPFALKIFRAGLLVACLALLIGLCCCLEPYSIPSAQPLSLHYNEVDTSILLIENGACCPLNEAEKETVLEQSAHLIVQELALEGLSDDVQFSLLEVSLSYQPALQQRLTPLFDGAVYLQADSIPFERQVVCDSMVPGKAQEAVLDAIEAAYVFSDSGCSAALAAPGLLVPGTGQYAAVMFVPRVYLIRGVFAIGSNRYPMEIIYPCLNSLNVMDGIYCVYEEDVPDAFLK